MTKTQSEIAQDIFDFLPETYDVPNSGGNYMKFSAGENKFRILQSPILGWELWINNKPKRYPMNVEVPIEDQENADIDPATSMPKPAKHFWAMFVWNYQLKKVQALEITQKGIQASLKALAKSSEWGSPLGYDISIIKEGQKFETKYQVVPNPPKDLPEEAREFWKNVKNKYDISALFVGGDPFKV